MKKASMLVRLTVTGEAVWIMAWMLWTAESNALGIVMSGTTMCWRRGEVLASGDCVYWAKTGLDCSFVRVDGERDVPMTV